jgi:hypothetical protein
MDGVHSGKWQAALFEGKESSGFVNEVGKEGFGNDLRDRTRSHPIDVTGFVLLHAPGLRSTLGRCAGCSGRHRDLLRRPAAGTFCALKDS